MNTTSAFPVTDGTLVYDVRGEGPLVICLPGMGDLRQSYTGLADALVAAGHRVVTVDLRGHGESATTFTDHTRERAGADVLALLDHLGADGPVHLIGCSYGASAVAWAAGERPSAVGGLTLIGPFVRDRPVTAGQRLALRLMLTRPWGARAWAAWFRKIHRLAPADMDARVEAARRMVAQPGRLEAVRSMALTGLDAVDEALDRITASTLVVMGQEDPDFPDPAAEAQAIADRTGGDVLVVAGAGHYPHLEAPEAVVPQIVDHVRSSTCHPAG
jgi:pimeloyl-ACP methyl ester carboxylesterase